jgi:hypothetical protein
MRAIDLLAGRLEAAMSLGMARPWERCDDLDRCVAVMRKQIKDGPPLNDAPDQQVEALARFWVSRRIETTRDGRLVCFGLTRVAGPKNVAIIDESECFRAVLDGVDQFLPSPRRFRRCYQGLLASYFEYDPGRERVPASGKENWETLRHFLQLRAEKIVEPELNPDWVDMLQQHLSLLSNDPCRPYGKLLLDDNDAAIQQLRACLGIPEASWFTRSLILSTVATATERVDKAFVAKIQFLLRLLSTHVVVRDQGMATILDRYTTVTPPVRFGPLREAAVKWWGNPWLSAHRMRWGAVSPAARAMVSDWLKLEFIEAFFSVLAEERAGDTRRLEFWKKYVHSIEDVTFALGADARESNVKDLVDLRKKMEGLQVPLQDPARANNAFIMRMGKVTVVEFGAPGNACYFYDGARPLPFDVSKPVVTPVGARNSLKHKSHALKLRHQDGIHSFGRWEELFEAELRQKFGIAPTTSSIVVGHRLRAVSSGAPSSPTKAAIAAPSGHVPQCTDWQRTDYSRENLANFVAHFHLRIEDFSQRNGNIWVRTDDSRRDINAVLRNWGFSYKAPKGWWR